MVTKIPSRIGVLWTHIHFWFWPLFNSMKKRYCHWNINQIILNHTTLQNFRSSFKSYWLWIFPWIKLSWHSCSMWGKLGWLNRFYQFLGEGLSSFNLKGFFYSYPWSCSLCEGKASFSMGFISRILGIFLFVFDLLYFIQSLTSFSSINHLLCLYAQFLMLFLLT